MDRALTPPPPHAAGRAPPPWLLSLGCAALLWGCGGGTQSGRARQSAGEKAWQASQVADPAPARAAPLPPSGADAQEPKGDMAANAAMKRGLARYRRSLKNAARRDRELETLVRRYLAVTREVFTRLQRTPGGTPGGTSLSYDPLPAWRFQARAVWELRSISARAGVVREHLQEMARALSLDLSAPAEPRGRAGRVAHFDKVMGCIEADASRRARHGLAYLRAASIREPVLAPPRRAQLLQEELKLMRDSVRCATLAADRDAHRRP